MDRLREMNVRTLLNTRIDLKSLRSPPPTPYACNTPTIGSAGTPDLSPTFSTPDLSESPCPTPPPASPYLSSFVLPSPVVQPEDSCATIKTTDGREINADLIVRSLLSLTDCWPLRSPSSFVQARPTIPRSWRCCHPNQLTTKRGRQRTSYPLFNLGSRPIMENWSSPSTHIFLSSEMQPMHSGPLNLAARLGGR